MVTVGYGSFFVVHLVFKSPSTQLSGPNLFFFLLDIFTDTGVITSPSEQDVSPGKIQDQNGTKLLRFKLVDERLRVSIGPDDICIQGVISWRASGDRQISLSASDERAFANFRVKNVVFTGTHFCAVLSMHCNAMQCNAMVGERAFVNFRKFVN